MEDDRVLIHERPKMKEPRLVLGFSGWMNGGEVSTGTVQYLCNKMDVKLLAELDSEDFYIQNFPGTMEVTSMFRPYARIEDGLVTEYEGGADGDAAGYRDGADGRRGLLVL